MPARWRGGGAGQRLPGHELVPRHAGPRSLAGRLLRRRRGQWRRAGRREPAPPLGAGGCSAVVASASAWCYATDDERAWWGGLWADRIETTALGTRAVELGLTHPDEIAEMAGAWRAWAAVPDAWFAVLHGEILATP